MGSRLFDPAIVGTAEKVVEFIGNILLWNDGARYGRKGWHRYLDCHFDRDAATTTTCSIEHL